MADNVQFIENIIALDRARYEDLIRTETKYNLLRNALEDYTGYANIEELKKCFGIPDKTMPLIGR